MRIASFNVDSLDMRPNADVSLDDRIPILRPQLERLRADVVCLQEINGQHPSGGGPRALLALDKLLEGTRYEGYARAASTAQSVAGLADVHNLVTLSRWPILRFKSIQKLPLRLLRQFRSPDLVPELCTIENANIDAVAGASPRSE
jgi:endonuclease/exonuclease/phosphatase family metal-dependent hydrolase